MAKESKVISFGLTEEAMEYLDKMNEKYGDKGENKKEKEIGDDVKREVVKIVGEQVNRINEKLNELKDNDIENDRWCKLIDALDKSMNIVRFM